MVAQFGLLDGCALFVTLRSECASLAVRYADLRSSFTAVGTAVSDRSIPQGKVTP